MRRALALLLPVACAACADLHFAPLGEHARVVLVGAAAPADVAAVQYLRAYRDVRCNGARTRGLSITLGQARQTKALDVDANQRVFLFATAERWRIRDAKDGAGAVDLVGNRCETLVSFITAPSHAYLVSEGADDDVCHFAVIDQWTSLPPPDLAEHNPTLCNELGRRRQPVPTK